MSKLGFRMDMLKAALARIVGATTRVVVFAAIAVAGGIGSALYMTRQPTPLTTTRVGPWVTWTAAGRPDADPYTRVRFARLGSLPLNAAVARVYEARTDSDGQRLNSACTYAVEGRKIEAAWWSLAVYTDSGRMIANPAERHAFNASSIARSADGSFVVMLAREAQPGNWLPTGGAGRLALILTTYGVPDQSIAGDQAPATTLPRIRKVDCR